MFDLFSFLLILSLIITKPPSHTRLQTYVVQKPLTPSAIYIPSAAISLPIQEARIEDNQWQLTDGRTAFFGTTSALPGEAGTTVIFAHARQGLFAKLPILKKDAGIAVQAGDKIYLYQIDYSKLVPADDVSFIDKQGKNRLVLLTCFGSHDAYRILFFGKLIERTSTKSINKNLYNI